jgi:hypothetical protein
MATGVEISEISQDVKDFTRTQHEKRRANQPYGGPEWRMTRRLAESLYPDHGT